MGERFKCDIRLVTPEVAAKWLECNRKNRPVSPTRVDGYADSMKRNLWGESNDAIAFDVEGNLINGQHRLLAIVKSGKTIPLLVAHGLPSDSFAHMDTHGKRNVGDVLGIIGHRQTRTLAAAARICVVAERGHIFEKPQNSWKGMPTHRVNVDDVMAFVEANPSLVESVRVAGEHRVPPGMLDKSILAAFHYFAAKKDRDAADKFVRDIQRGSELTPDDPVYLVRERLLSLANSGVGSTPGEKMNMIVRAWNMRRSGRKMEKFQVGRRASPDANRNEIVTPKLA